MRYYSKRVLSLLMALAMLCSLFVIPANAATAKDVDVQLRFFTASGNTWNASDITGDTIPSGTYVIAKLVPSEDVSFSAGMFSISVAPAFTYVANKSEVTWPDPDDPELKITLRFSPNSYQTATGQTIGVFKGTFADSDARTCPAGTGILLLRLKAEQDISVGDLPDLIKVEALNATSDVTVYGVERCRSYIQNAVRGQEVDYTMTIIPCPTLTAAQKTGSTLYDSAAVADVKNALTVNAVNASGTATAVTSYDLYTDEACTKALTDGGLSSGSQTLYVKADGYPVTSVTVTATADTLSSIAVTNPPSKTAYTSGEFFNPADMEVTATYASGAKNVVTGYTWTPDEKTPLTVSDTSVTISYTDDPTTAAGTKTTTQAITVAPVSVAKPTAEGSYTYIGTEQTFTIGNSSDKYDLSADPKGTNAGQYSITASLNSTEYAWSDGTTTPVSLSWTIGPADCSLTVGTTQNVKVGSGLAAITVVPTPPVAAGVTPTGGTTETVNGTVTWYSDSARTVPAKDTDLSSKTVGDTVTLYWQFTPTGTNNYLPVVGATEFTVVEGDPQLPVFASGLDFTKTYGDDSFTNAVTEVRSDGKVITDGGKITYASDDETVAAVNPTTGEVTIIGQGTATITATAAAVSGKYAEGSASYKVTVNQKEAALTWSTDPLTYNGEAQAPTATVSNVVTGDTCEVTAYTGLETNAGTGYTVTATALSDDNYKLPSDASQGFTIAKAASPTLTAPTQTLLSNEAVEGAKAYSFDLSSIISGVKDDAGTVTYAATAGNYTGDVTVNGANLEFTVATPKPKGTTDAVTVTVDTANYEDATVTVNFEFLDKKAAVISMSDTTVDYDGTAKEMTASVTTPETADPDSLTITYEGAGSTSYAKTETAPTDAGTYTVTAIYDQTVADPTDPGYPGYFGTDTATLTISPKAITITGVTATDKEYDGTTDINTLTGGTLQGVVSGDDVGFTLGTGTAADKNVGINKAVTTNITLTGNDKDNYILTQPDDVVATITPKPVTVAGLSVSDKDYDGTTEAVIDSSVTPTITGMVSGDDLAADTTAATAAFAQKDVKLAAGGSVDVIDVTVSGVALAGNDAANYELSAQPADVQAKINPLTAVLSWGSTALTYTGELQAPECTVANLVTGDTCTVTVTGQETDVGTGYTATADSLSNPNYVLPATVTQSFSIAKADQSVPTGLNGVAPETDDPSAKGKITGTTAAMEYAVVDDGNPTWNPCSDTETELFPDTYLVRFAGSTNYNPSDTVQVVVPTKNTVMYTITVNTAAGGTAAASVATAPEGAKVTLVGTPSEGYLLTDWSGVTLDSGSDDTFTMGAADVTVTPVFEKAITVTPAAVAITVNGSATLTATLASSLTGAAITWDSDNTSFATVDSTGKVTGIAVGTAKITATITVNGQDYSAVSNITVSSGGSGGGGGGGAAPVSATNPVNLPASSSNTHGKVTASTTNAKAGDKVTLTVTPDEGYKVSNVTVTDKNNKDVPVTKNNDGTYSFTMPNSPVTVNPVFVKNGENPVTIPASASANHGKVTSDVDSAKPGDKVTLTATPDEGYQAGVPKVTDTNGNPVTVTDNGDGTYSFIMPEDGVTVTPVFNQTAPAASRFVDVPADAYYYDAVYWAVDKGITTGTDDTHFSPNDPCTRAQAVTFLWRGLGQPTPNSSYNPFTDVKEGVYYYDAVLWAVEKGITKGTSDTTFSPNDTVTRAQIVTLLYRLIQANGGGFTGAWAFPLDFTDAADVPEWAYEAFCWMTMNDVVKGSDGKLMPNEECLRAQIVTIMYRANDQI